MWLARLRQNMSPYGNQRQFKPRKLEVTKTIVEGSMTVANHKGGASLEVEDVTLFLGNFTSQLENKGLLID